jgi:uncharacterized protein (DUF1697 family)
VLLRGINLGPRRRVAMAGLRELLSGAGFREVQTYLQSGNVVLGSDLPAAEVAAACESLISERFGFDVPVVVRTGQELAKVVARDPLGSEADNPKRQQVTFLERKLEADRVRELEALAAPSERVLVRGREIYTWHPEGIARSALAAQLAAASLGVKATARNWTTVTKLLAMAQPDG